MATSAFDLDHAFGTVDSDVDFDHIPLLSHHPPLSPHHDRNRQFDVTREELLTEGVHMMRSFLQWGSFEKSALEYRALSKKNRPQRKCCGNVLIPHERHRLIRSERPTLTGSVAGKIPGIQGRKSLRTWVQESPIPYLEFQFGKRFAGCKRAY